MLELNSTLPAGFPQKYIARWNGTTWSPLGSGISDTYRWVYALAVDESENVYAGGQFLAAGGKSSMHIAEWMSSAPPAVTQISPTSGPVGTDVTITGTNFGATQGTSTLKFNGVAATTFTSWSTTQIKCKVPTGATTGPVTVTTGGGTSNGVTFTVIPAPSITLLIPYSGRVGKKVTITGTNFGGTRDTSVAKFNGVPVTKYIWWTDTSITCKVPAGAKTGPVTVTTSGGTSNGVTFKVKRSSALQSLAGPGQEVTAGERVRLSAANSIGLAGEPNALRWTQVDGAAVEISDPAAIETTFVAPKAGIDGTSLRFALTVVVENGLESRDSCIVNVTQGNAPPEANAGKHQTVVGSEIVMLDGSGSTDRDDGIASYEWEQISGTPVTLVAPSDMQPTFVVPNVDSKGESLIFELTVTDQGGLRSRDRCVVNVRASNEPPTAHAGPGLNVRPGAKVLLDGSDSADPDGAIVSYTWRQTSGQPVTLSDPEAVKPTFVAPDTDGSFEVLTFELTVTDAGGLSHTDRVSITVTGDSTGKESVGSSQRGRSSDTR
jgi:hypothetical protein